MSKREITLNFGTKEFKFIDLEHPNANNAFASYYQSMFGIPAIDMQSFETSSEAYFNSIEDKEDKFLKHDLYFNNFTPVWLNLIQQRRFTEAEKIWRDALDIAFRWEKYRKLRIHKGTPYYFWAVTCFLNEDIDKGFWLMNQAYIEDKITHNTEEPDTPSKYFLYFETSQEQQFFRDKLLQIKEFLNKNLIENYSTIRSKTFDYSLFENKFLKNQQISKDVKFHFNLNVFRLERILKQQKPNERNTVASLLYLEIIFDLCRVFEYLIKINSQDKFLDSVKNLAKEYKVNSAILQINPSDFNTDNFMTTLENILNNNFQINSSTVDNLEKDILVTYGFRNFGAHKIEENSIIVANFEKIVKSITNSILLAIELKPRT
jgi:hypothetical protein